MRWEVIWGLVMQVIIATLQCCTLQDLVHLVTTAMAVFGANRLLMIPNTDHPKQLHSFMGGA